MPRINIDNFPKFCKETIEHMGRLEDAIYQESSNPATRESVPQMQSITDKLIQFNKLALQILQSRHNDKEKQLKELISVVCDVNSHVFYLTPKSIVFLEENVRLLGKIWVQLDELVDSPRIKCKTAFMVCNALGRLLEFYGQNNDLNNLFFTASQLLFWRERVSDTPPGKISIVSQIYKNKIYLNAKQDKFESLAKAYAAFIKVYAQQKNFSEVIRLLTEIARNNSLINPKFLDDMFDLFNVIDPNLLFVKKEIANLLLMYISKPDFAQLNQHGIEYLADSRAALNRSIAQLNDLIANFYVRWVNDLDLKALSAKYHEREKCLQLKWDTNIVSFETVEAMLKKLKPFPILKHRPGRDLLIYKLEDVSPMAVLILNQIDALIIKRPVQSAIDDCITKIRQLRFNLPAALPVLSSSNTPMANPKPNIACEPKARSSKATKIKKIAIEKEKTLEPCQGLKKRHRAHELGFKLDQADVPIYDISAGDHIPPGIYYSYGIQLQRGLREVSETDLREYQQILEEGQIVTRGRRGLRIVRPKESGLHEQVLFKITHPRRDLRILMTPEEFVTDASGQKKYLYCAGIPKFHK